MDGHTRQLPVITEGPFEYSNYAVEYLLAAKAVAGSEAKIKQAVISASAMSLLYPPEPIATYSREEFIEDVVRCAVKDIRLCLDEGADSVQVDFTEGRLSLKLDPSGGLLQQFLDLNERVFSAFSAEDLQRILEFMYAQVPMPTALIPSISCTLRCCHLYSRHSVVVVSTSR